MTLYEEAKQLIPGGSQLAIPRNEVCYKGHLYANDYRVGLDNRNGRYYLRCQILLVR